MAGMALFRILGSVFYYVGDPCENKIVEYIIYEGGKYSILLDIFLTPKLGTFLSMEKCGLSFNNSYSPRKWPSSAIVGRGRADY